MNLKPSENVNPASSPNNSATLQVVSAMNSIAREARIEAYQRSVAIVVLVKARAKSWEDRNLIEEIETAISSEIESLVKDR